eukprot:2529186-Rhodomonas_salina.2
MIVEHVQRHGTKSWSLLAGSIPGRTGKQMRERWHNQVKHFALSAKSPYETPKALRHECVFC